MLQGKQKNIMEIIDEMERHFKTTPKYLLTFALNKHEKIVIKLDKPDDIIECCYNLNIYFMQYNHKMLLSRRIGAREFAESFIICLENLLKNKLVLSEDTIPDVGSYWNFNLTKENHKAFITDEWFEDYDQLKKNTPCMADYFMSFFNDDSGNIILQISPSYPRQYVRRNKKPTYNNFLHWMKTYKIKVNRIVTKDIAENWLDQSRQLLGIVKNNIYEMFKKSPEEEAKLRQEMAEMRKAYVAEKEKI